VANIQVTHDMNVNNARSESSVVVNPNNPSQVVSASKKFNDIHTYDFTLATEYSSDGGKTWHDSAALAMPGFTVMTDPTMAWDDVGNVFLVGLAGQNPPAWDAIGMVIYKSTDGGQTWSAPLRIHTDASDDKQWAAGDTNPSSPHHGNVYAVWDDSSGIAFARTKNHGSTWIGPGAAASPAGGTIFHDGCIFPEINVADDGTVYVAAIAGTSIHLHVSADGGDTFSARQMPATGISPLGPGLPFAGTPPYTFPVFPGGTFRVLTDPTACAFGTTVTVAWADFREGVSRIYFARSTDRGLSWQTPATGQPLLTSAIPSNFQHFHPQMITDHNGVIGSSFYEFGPKPVAAKIDVLFAQSFDNGVSFNHFTVTDQPWDPAIDAPWSHGDSAVTFIGDYFGLDASPIGFLPLWTDTRTGIQELFTAIVPERRCEIIVNRSTIGEDEVRARRQAAGPRAVIPDALRVVVDGYTAAQLGLTGATSTLLLASPVTGMTINCTGNVSGTGGYGAEIQRFTFLYEFDFGTSHADPAFSFPGPTLFATINAAAAEVACAAEIELIKQPNPFILHGDPTWLSVDLRTFVVRANETKFGVQMGPTAASAPDFIQQLTHALTAGGGIAGGQAFDNPNVLPPDEQHSALYVQPRDENNTLVFNFALARVRYVGLIGAADVRVFFRLFQAQTTSGAYDYPPGSRYRRAVSNPAGQPIPLPGIQGNEYVTLPFFALPRVNSSTTSLTEQTDSRLVSGTVFGNVQHIAPHADGSEVDTFFGCWLDINQPSLSVIPATRDATNPDGPFQSVTNPPRSIQQALLRSLHQCLIAEVAFDPVAIPIGKDPSNWDKLAQRNIAWSDVGSALAVTTFEVRPSPVGLPADHRPDELMIDWGSVPDNSVATIFLPGADADQILDLAGRMYVSHPLTRLDDHTLRWLTQGITYLPVPQQSGPDLAGLLTVEPRGSYRKGEELTVVVRQVTNASSARLRREVDEFVGDEGREGAADPDGVAGGFERSAPGVTQEGRMGRSEYEYRRWRRVLGAFQLTAPVGDARALLKREERNLSVLKSIRSSILPDSRWQPVFDRFVDVIGIRVKVFGGDPMDVGASPEGNPRGDAGSQRGGCGFPWRILRWLRRTWRLIVD
jgi:hypothetical protein